MLKRLHPYGTMAAGFVLLTLTVPSTAFAQDANVAGLMENVNHIWILICAALVFLMQAGFMCVESGLARAKNSINVAIKNMADFLISVLLFWLVGFGIMFGASCFGFFGTTHFMENVANNPGLTSFLVFQAVFCGTAATIDSGAISERTRFGTYLIISAITSALIYPVFGHWVWGGALNGTSGGWLQQLGFIDFAGSTVVHSLGGWVALAGVIVVGPRIDRFDENGKPRKIPPHNLLLVFLGTFILFFGWFGFNCGSTLEAVPAVATIAWHTMLAASCGGMVAAGISWWRTRIFGPEMISYGVLGGLVAITAGCAVVSTMGAALIGVAAGITVVAGCAFNENVLKVDDVVGAVAVHGYCGAVGTMAIPFFIMELPAGMTQWSLLGVQATGVLACFVWAFGCAFIMLSLARKFIGLRVTEENERIGLNVAEHGARSTILDLWQSMEKVTTSGNYDDTAKVEPEHGTEYGDLANQFNQMVDAINAEQTLVAQARERDKLYKTLFDSADDGIITICPEEGFVTANPAAVKMFHCQSEEELLAVDPLSLFPELQLNGNRSENVLNERIAEALADGSARFEWVHRRLDGQEFTASVILARMSTNEKVLLQATIRDETERQLVERELADLNEELIKTSRVAGVADFATGVLHNVGNILNSVNLSASIIRRKFEKGAFSNLKKLASLVTEHDKDFAGFVRDDSRGQKIPAYLQKLTEKMAEERDHISVEFQDLLDNVEHIREIVKVQQSYAKSKNLVQMLCPVDIVECALTASKGSLRNHKIAVVQNYDPDLPDVHSDKHKILQILVNLITNARDAIKERQPTNPGIEIGISAENGIVSFSVCDNGVGISADKLEKLFQHGYTTKKSGHGFGLHASANTATELGGTLTVSSDGNGRGATFNLSLPIQKVDDPPNDESEIEPRRTEPKRRVGI